jgi:hypothetical protein
MASRNLDAPPIPDDVRALAERVGTDPLHWPFNCHSASHAIVQSGIYPGARVARGWARGVAGQHSWVVVGDPYDEDARIIDATLWSYDPSRVPGVWEGTQRDRVHTPHGAGHLLTGQPPTHHGGETIHLLPEVSASARRFLRLVGAPFDAAGWVELANLPVGGWPAAEILAAMDDTPRLTALVPMDRLGMLTDRNPGGLYMRADDPEEGQ